MKRIATHSHVIPATLIEAMREKPELYRTRIEGESGSYQFMRGKATLPMPHPEAAVAELERVVKEHGFKGIEVATSVMGEEQPVQKLDAVPGLTAKEREDVSFRTAAKLFGETF